MKTVLVLDDDLRRHEHITQTLIGFDLVHVFTARAAIEALANRDRFYLALLDHDLTFLQSAGKQDLEMSGTDVAHYISVMPIDKRPEKVVIHSWNPVGAKRMENILKDAGVYVVRMPFSK